MPEPFVVTAFASSASVPESHFEAARAFGRGVGERGWTLVYGGNRPGPMGRMAQAARDAGGRVVGVTPHLFANDPASGIGDVVDRDCDELVMVDTMRQRKAEMERRGHAFVTLSGGIGTLEEFFEILVGRHLRQHDKPVILLNHDDYYAPLLEWLRRGTLDGFVRKQVWEQLHVADSVEAALRELDAVATAGAS